MKIFKTNRERKNYASKPIISMAALRFYHPPPRISDLCAEQESNAFASSECKVLSMEY